MSLPCPPLPPYYLSPSTNSSLPTPLSPLPKSLPSGSEKLRTYVANHALPVVLTLDPRSAAAMVRRIAADAAADAREPAPGTSRCAALVAVLKVWEGGRGERARVLGRVRN